MPTREELEEHLNNFLAEGRLREERADFTALNQQKIDDFIAGKTQLDTDFRNAGIAIEIQSTLGSGSSALAGSGVGASVGLAFGGLPGAAVGGVAGGLVGLGGELFFKADEVVKKMDLTSQQKKVMDDFLKTAEVYSQSLYEQARRSDVTQGFLSQDLDYEKGLMQFVQASDLPIELKTPFIAKQMQLLSNRLKDTAKNQKTLSNSVDSLKARDQQQQQEINSMKSAVVNFGNALDKLSDDVNTLSHQIDEQSLMLDQLSVQVTNVENSLGQVQQQLKQQDLRLTNLELVADLAFSELTRVSTNNLEQYDENIASLHREYNDLRNDNGVSRQTVLAKRAELQAAVNQKTIEVQSLKEDFDTFFGVTNLLMQFGQAVGSVEIQRATQIISSVAQVGIGIAALAGVGGSALKALAGGAALGPVGMIAGGIIGLISIFGGGSGDNGIAKALQQISEQIEALSKQVADLGHYVTQRFDSIEDILFDQRRLILSNTRDLIELLSTFNKNVMKNFVSLNDRISGIQQLVSQVGNKLNDISSAVDQGFATLYGQEFNRIVTRIVNYYDNQKPGTVPALDETQVRQALLTMVDWATVGASNAILHGDLAGNYDLARLLTISDDEVLNRVNLLLGILRAQGISFAPKALPANLTLSLDGTDNCFLPTNNNNRVINPQAYALAVGNILKFVQSVPEYFPRSQDRCQLEQLLRSARTFLSTVQGLKTNAEPVQHFLDLYERSVDALIHFVYRTTVETLAVRGEDIAPDLDRVSQLAESLNSQYQPLLTELSELNSVVQEAYQLILDSCFVCAWTNDFQEKTLEDFEESLAYSGQGFCDSPSTSTFSGSNLTPGCDFGSSFYENLIPSLPNTDCHSADNTMLVKNVNTQVQAGLPNIVDSSKLQSAISVLTQVKWVTLNRKFTGPTTSYPTLLPNSFGVKLSSLTLVDLIDQFLGRVTACFIYIKLGVRFGLSGFPGQATYEGPFYDYNKPFSILTDVNQALTKVRNLLRQTGNQQILFVDLINQINRLLPGISKKLQQAHVLRIEDLFHLNNPTKNQIQTMLQTTITWFATHATSTERTQVVQALLTSINNQGQLKQILDQLDIAKKGLRLVLDLAYSEEFAADDVSQLMLQLMFDSSSVLTSLLGFDSDDTTLPILNQLNTQLATNTEDILSQNTTVRLERNFLNETREYFLRVVQDGQLAAEASQLMPGYSWLLQLVDRIIWVGNNVFPQGVAFRDITAARVVSAVQQNETVVLDILNTPLLKLVDTRDQNQNTPYLLAVAACEFSTVVDLFKRQATVNVLNDNRHSALNLALQCPFFADRQSMLKLLLGQGVTECRATDQLHQELLTIYNAQPALLANVTCLSFAVTMLATISETTTSSASRQTTILTTVNNLPTTTTSEKTVDGDAEGTSNDGLSEQTILIVTAIAAVAMISAVAIVMICRRQDRANNQAVGGQAAVVQPDVAQALQTLAAAGLTVNQLVKETEASSIPSKSVHSSQLTNTTRTDGVDAIPSQTLSGQAGWYGEGDAAQAVYYQAGEYGQTLIFAQGEAESLAPVTKDHYAQQTPIVDDTYDPGTCSPIEFGGRPSVACEGEKTTLVYQPTILPPHQHVAKALTEGGVNETIAQVTIQPFADFSGNLMLGQVFVHWFNQLSHWYHGKVTESPEIEDCKVDYVAEYQPPAHVPTKQQTWGEAFCGMFEHPWIKFRASNEEPADSMCGESAAQNQSAFVAHATLFGGQGEQCASANQSGPLLLGRSI